MGKRSKGENISQITSEGSEMGNPYPETGWYLEGFGIPPFPVPKTEIQLMGALLLGGDALKTLFDDGDGPDHIILDPCHAGLLENPHMAEVMRKNGITAST